MGTLGINPSEASAGVEGAEHQGWNHSSLTAASSQSDAQQPLHEGTENEWTL